MHPLPDGVPIAVAAAKNFKAACERIVAVLRPEYQDLASALVEVGCEIVFCPDAIYGMGHSLAAGVRNTANASACRALTTMSSACMRAA
jgi:molybdenum cofactor cytidylyltransferase